jgi:hypothetical protein
MNRHTFKDMIGAKRGSLANDLDEDEDDDREMRSYRKGFEGEEKAGDVKFNEVGEVIESFNLRDERQLGNFDESGNFVFKKEGREVDAWLADIDETAMEKGIGEAANAVRLQQAREKAEEQKENERLQLSAMDIYSELHSIMNKGDNVSRCMKRLSDAAKVKPTKTSTSSTSAKESSQVEEQKLRKLQKDQLNRLIELSDHLLLLGVVNVYDVSYDSVESNTCNWQYRGLDGTMNGPFDSHSIRQWMSQGYFTGRSAVYMRRVVGGSAAPTGHDSQHSSADLGASANAKKKMKIESSSLMDDLEDDDDDDGDGDDGGQAAASNAETPSVGAKVPVEQVVEVSYGPWTLSDEVDFGGRVLPDIASLNSKIAERIEQRRREREKERQLEEEKERASAKAAQRRNFGGESKSNYDDEGDDGDDGENNDDEEVDDDDDDFDAQQERNMTNRKRPRAQDDDDDDDD